MTSFSRLQEASDCEVEKWLNESIPELSKYQKDYISKEEIVRFSKFRFYKWKKLKPVSFTWRLTMPFFFIFWCILFIGIPFNFLATGHWAYTQKFIDKFYAPWMRKLNFDL